jgi:hypothetical protein
MTTVTPATHWRTESSFVSLSAGTLALASESRASQTQSAKREVEVNSDKLERLRAEIEQALEKAKEAEEDAGVWGSLSDFFGVDVAKVAQAVAAVAAVAATGGAATPFLVAALACSAAAEIGEAAGLDPKLCMGLAVAGAALGFCAGNAGGAGTFAKLGSAASVVGGGAQAAGGAFSIVEGEYRADAQRENARADLTRSKEQEVELQLRQILERLKQLQNAATQQSRTTSTTLESTRIGYDAVLDNLNAEGPR